MSTFDVTPEAKERCVKMLKRERDRVIDKAHEKRLTMKALLAYAKGIDELLKIYEGDEYIGQ